MHDPDHVVFTIRRPWAKGRPADNNGRQFGFWALRDRVYRDLNDNEVRTPLRRRVYASWAFFRIGNREWFLPGLLTVWHHDPETDGTDSSCRNAARKRRQDAIKRHAFFAAAWWDFWWRHYDVFHVHHWTLQVDVAQRWRRRLFTRCGTCGGREERGRAINVRVVVDRDAEDRRYKDRSFRERWLTGEANLHHWDCAPLASIRATKVNLPSWLKQWGKDEWCMNHQREQEPLYGCYPWWREAILGEDPETAAMLAGAHVQRSCQPCPDCKGAGVTEVTGTITVYTATMRTIDSAIRERDVCERCDGTGHERVEQPIPAEMV